MVEHCLPGTVVLRGDGGSWTVQEVRITAPLKVSGQDESHKQPKQLIMQRVIQSTYP